MAVTDINWARSRALERPNDDAAPLGLMIRALRRQQQFSQNALAAAAGVDQAYLNRLERSPDPIRPWRNVVERLAAALDASDEDLDRLLAAADYLPASVVACGGWDDFVAVQRGQIGVLECKLSLRDQHIRQLATENLRLRRMQP